MAKKNTWIVIGVIVAFIVIAGYSKIGTQALVINNNLQPLIDACEANEKIYRCMGQTPNFFCKDDPVFDSGDRCTNFATCVDNTVVYGCDLCDQNQFMCREDGQIYQCLDNYLYHLGQCSTIGLMGDYLDECTTDKARDTKAELCVQEGTCMDTDGGKDYFTRGFTQLCDGGDCFKDYDYCMSANTLVEFYCDGDEVNSISYDCPNGCTNGYCKEEIPVTCTDSDEGKAWFVKGFTEICSGSICSGDYDYCDDNMTLVEYYCVGSDSQVINHNCEFGCDDGECQGEGPGPTTKCTSDSDCNETKCEECYQGECSNKCAFWDKCDKGDCELNMTIIWVIGGLFAAVIFMRKSKGKG